MDHYSKFANLSQNPLWELPEHDPRCFNVSCLAYIVGWMDDQKHYSNDKFPIYALWVVYFTVALLGIFIIAHINKRLQDGGSGTKLKERGIAYWRMWSYRRLKGRAGEWTDLSYGQLILFVVATIFISILPFFQGYFLRDYFKYGSPPISVRAAFLISALLPISIALTGKVNLISLATGVSYARLNVWHRYTALVMYALTIVHLVPHFIAPARDGGVAEIRQLIVDGKKELSGVILQFVFTLMLLTSLPWLRNRIYELFKILHIFFAISFLGLFYWHIVGEKYTPEILWATIAVLVGNYIARTIYRNRVAVSSREFIHGFPTSLEVMPDKMTRIVIQCPRKLSWKPGQHCYISIPRISIGQAHPFTIVSLSTNSKTDDANDLVLLMRACKGFTKQVENLAVRSVGPGSGGTKSLNSDSAWSAVAEAEVQMHSRSWVDGPYGDFHTTLERQYHGVICVSGGSGITASLPWLVHLASRMRLAANGNRGLHGEKLCKTRSLHLIWSIRKLCWIRWAERELLEAMREVMRANMPPTTRHYDEKENKEPRTTSRLHISIQVTQPVQPSELKAACIEIYLAAGVDVNNPHVRVEILSGRPNFMEILPNKLDRKRNIVMTCGPIGQKIDVSNSVARLQSMVLENQAREITLHSETFGW